LYIIEFQERGLPHAHILIWLHHYNELTIDAKGYPICRTRDDGRFVQKGDVKLDKNYVVPHNLNLLIKYQAHINVEWCTRSKAIKYLFKYINKGLNRATIFVQENVTRNEISGLKIIINVYLDCRYIFACEACWRIYQFDIHYILNSSS